MILTYSVKKHCTILLFALCSSIAHAQWSYEYSNTINKTIKIGEEITLTPMQDDSTIKEYFNNCKPTAQNTFPKGDACIILSSNIYSSTPSRDPQIELIGFKQGTYTYEYRLSCLSRYSINGQRSNTHVHITYKIKVESSANEYIQLKLENDPGQRLIKGESYGIKLQANDEDAIIYFNTSGSGYSTSIGKADITIRGTYLKAFAIKPDKGSSNIIEQSYSRILPGNFHGMIDGVDMHFNYVDHDEKTCELYYVPQTIKECTIPKTANGYTVVSIGEKAFYQSPVLTSVVIPETIKTIDEYAFSGCSALTSVTIPGSVMSIQRYAFSQCSNLKSFTIEDGLQEIESFAFVNDSCLEEITIPASVKTIDQAFGHCTALKKVISFNTNPQPIPLAFWQSSSIPWTSATLYVPKGCKEKYQFTEGWMKFNTIVEMDDPVPSLLKGDVNGDNNVNGTDIVALVNIILGKQAETDAADVNGDGNVNGTDIVALCNIILGRASAPKRVTKKAEVEGQAYLSISENFDIKAGETKDMVIDLTNPNDELTLVQFDLSLPEGLSIKKTSGELAIDMCDRTTWRKHSLEANEVDGAYRFLLYSGSNTLIDGTSGGIITVTLTADDTFEGGTIVLNNSLLVTPAQKEIKPVKYEYSIGEVIPPTSETASLSIESFSIKAGETKDMVIDLTNPDDELTLVQFDLSLPDGLSIKKTGGELAIDMCDRTTWRKHSLEANEVEGAYRFLLYSGSNTLIDGTGGGIITVTLTADDTFEGGTIVLNNSLLVTPAQKEIKPVKYEYSIGEVIPPTSETASLSIESFSIQAGETKDMVIDLTNPNDELTLVQFDLSLPDGLSIKKTGGELDIDMCDRTTWRKHSLEANEVEGAYRFLLYSGSNTLIDGTGGGIITVTLTADDTFEGGTIIIDNTLLVTPAQKEIKPVKYEYQIGSTTGIGEILDKQKPLQIYNLNGQWLKQPQKGINVINGKKVMVK